MQGSGSSAWTVRTQTAASAAAAVLPSRPSAQPASPVLLALDVEVGPAPPKEPSDCWAEASQSVALVTASWMSTSSVWLCRAMTASAVTSVSGVAPASPSHVWFAAPGAAKSSRKKPAAHCCASRKSVTGSVSVLASASRPIAANACPMVLEKSASNGTLSS